MKVGDAIYEILSNDAGVTALIGNNTYPVVMPQNSDNYPAVVYTVTGTEPHDTKSGVSKIDEVIVQFDIYAATYSSVTDISNAVRGALDRHAHGTTNGVILDGIQYRGGQVGIEKEVDLFRFSDDYKIRVKYA